MAEVTTETTTCPARRNLFASQPAMDYNSGTAIDINSKISCYPIAVGIVDGFAAIPFHWETIDPAFKSTYEMYPFSEGFNMAFCLNKAYDGVDNFW